MDERTEIIARIASVIEQETDIQVVVEDESQSLRESFGLDSVDLVTVMMRIEGEYNIRLTQADLAEVKDIRSFVDLILAKRHPAPKLAA